MNCQNPIFVIGCERSGTTLLRIMLNEHPNLAIPGEAQRYSKMISSDEPWNSSWSHAGAIKVIREFLNVDKVQEWAPTVEEVVACLPATGIRYADIIDAVYFAYATNQNKKRWGDKTPINAFDLPAIIEAFPGAKFIQIVRDGRDVCLSWKKVDWVDYNTVAAAKKWNGWNWAVISAFKKAKSARLLTIRYEDLVKSPEATLVRICSFIGEEYSEQMLKYHEKIGKVGKAHLLLDRQPVASRAYIWKDEMSLADARAFENRAAPMLVKYDYDLNHAPKKRPDILWQIIKKKFLVSFEKISETANGE